MTGVLHAGYRPGAIGRVVELHGAYYHRVWGFGAFFEARVARDLAAFCAAFQEGRDGLWLVVLGGRVEGSIALDGSHAEASGAHLRWFILSDALRGKGWGHALLDAALAFARGRGYRRVHLDTFQGLDAARHLYEQAGFQLVGAAEGEQWGTRVMEQRFELHL